MLRKQSSAAHKGGIPTCGFGGGNILKCKKSVCYWMRHNATGCDTFLWI